MACPKCYGDICMCKSSAPDEYESGDRAYNTHVETALAELKIEIARIPKY